MNEVKILVCLRTLSLPIPHVPSSRKACSRCHQSVWCAASSLRAAGVDASIVCTECAAAIVAETTERVEVQPPTPEQIEELRAALGDRS